MSIFLFLRNRFRKMARVYSILTNSKSPRSFLQGLLCDRQQSILPGRFQPSTFDAWELNCCVRDGNRWGLPAIVTGSSKLYRRNYLQKTNLPYLASNQALDGLVPVRSIHCCTYTPGLSTLSSPRRLTDLCHERSHLGAGFTLRCFQRLSDPDVATQRYAWRHNWYTIGPSTPVLSY